MPYTGRLEIRPLLDVIQIIAYSQQSGILTVKGSSKKGLLIFQHGNVVCAYSPSTLPLLVKAAKELDERPRLTYRRVQILAALRELFDLADGDYRFVKKSDPVQELEGLDLRSFYAAGAIDTGDLLLVLEKAMDEEVELVPASSPPSEPEQESGRAQKRRFPRYGPVIIKGELSRPEGPLAGFLTNLSEGGTFFHADQLPLSGFVGTLEFELPWDMGRCRVSARTAWLRSDGPDAKRGAGLAFDAFEGDGKARLAAYLQQFEELAADVDFEA